MSAKPKIVHLLVPKEFRVFCIQSRAPSQLKFTTKPSACTCANCLTKYRRRQHPFPGKKGFRGEFKVSTIRNYHDRPL